MKTPWLVFPRPNPQAAVRLFCFPYAGGGSAIYNAWARQLPDFIELCSVRLPGRESRLAERPFTHMDALLSPLLTALQPHFDMPFVFFGHSMGAFIAFELARRLRQLGAALPRMLLLSGCRAPHLSALRPPIYHLPKDEFIAGIRQLGGTPDAVFAHPELLDLVLPALQADFELVETYQYQSGEPLAVPITAFGSVQDTIVSVEQVEEWETQTTAVFNSHIFSGDHFYLHTETTTLLTTLVAELRNL